MPLVPRRPTTGYELLPTPASAGRPSIEESEDQWEDARSDFSARTRPSAGVPPVLAAALVAQGVAGPPSPRQALAPRLTLSYQPRPPIPHWVPYPPLQFVDRQLTFVPVPPHTPFTGFWDQDLKRTTAPKPMDEAQHASSMTRRTHESIKTMKVRSMRLIVIATVCCCRQLASLFMCTTFYIL